MSGRTVEIPWRLLVGGVLVFAVLFWMAGTSVIGFLITLGLILAGCGAYLWRRHREIVRGVRRDLRPPQEQ